MGEPDVLDEGRLRAGLFVEYLGETNFDDLIEFADPPSQCDRQWRGHPGVITEPVIWQHVRVAWVGLEGTAASLGVGYGWGADGKLSGLAVIAEDEYQRRRLRVLAGQAPYDYS